MIKVIFQIAILLTLFISCKGQIENSVSHKMNYIDSIQNAKQIDELISKTDNRCNGFKTNDKLKFSENNCQKLSDSLKVKPWTKADFDNNGLTDILVIGSWYGYSVICILDKGVKYELYRITRRSFQACTFPIVENNKIKYYFENKLEPENFDKPSVLQEITLIYRFGDFIEENQNPTNHKIEKIEYCTTGCYGTCPIFNLIINSDKTASWKAEMYNKIKNKEISGNFNSKISEDKYNDLINLLNYMNFEALQDHYAVNWTDDQSSTLKITFDDGKVKSIQDYGLIGTYGLSRIYKLLFELRENQKWTK